MPKHIADKVFGHYLYFSSFCTIEAMHVHASDKKLTEQKSAKFFLRADGSSALRRRGDLTDREVAGIRANIKKNYLSMYALWSTMSSNGFYVGE
jgi:predicted transcriptional regulator of viral defense system